MASTHPTTSSIRCLETRERAGGSTIRRAAPRSGRGSVCWSRRA